MPSTCPTWKPSRPASAPVHAVSLLPRPELTLPPEGIREAPAEPLLSGAGLSGPPVDNGWPDPVQTHEVYCCWTCPPETLECRRHPWNLGQGRVSNQTESESLYDDKDMIDFDSKF